MKIELLRYVWWKRQGLDGSLRDDLPAEVLQRSGWARSVGGVGPYLTLFARTGVSREVVDQELADCNIHELPAARNCTYVVPKSDYELALRVGQEFEGGELKVALKLGVTESEINKLCVAVLGALKSGPLDPNAIRDATGKRSRSLGEEGKNKGVSTTLPIALSKLQATGAIRRIPVDGRLDQQRYRYALWDPSPMHNNYPDVEEAYRELARRFFSWVGPATIQEFRQFSGLGVRQSQAIFHALSLAPVDPASERFCLQEDLEEISRVSVPTKPQYALLSSLDSLFSTRRDVQSLIDKNDQAVSVISDKQINTLGRLSELPSHGVFDRGRLIGLWEYDLEKDKIAYKLFVKPDKQLLQSIEATQAYIQLQLGDARSFSLDSPKSRMPRIRHLEQL